MKLDNERQRAFLLTIIDNATFPGKVVEEIYELKTAIMKAQVETEPKKDKMIMLRKEEGDGK